MFFGIIHGLGFSVLLKSLLGSESSIILPLASFNIGLEIGQLSIVSVILILGFITVKYTKLRQKDWKIILSTIAFLIALYLIIDRRFW
jgi:hypothetical protein